MNLPPESIQYPDDQPFSKSNGIFRADLLTAVTADAFFIVKPDTPSELPNRIRRADPAALPATGASVRSVNGSGDQISACETIHDGRQEPKRVESGYLKVTWCKDLG